MLRVLVLLVLSTICALAADLTGNWKGSAETPNGTIERTFAFKQDGTKLTGETESSFTGKSKIEEGKVEGDSVSFVITANIQGQEMKLSYNGKISGDTIKFAVQGANDMRIEYIVKRVS